jgi:transcription elongation factor GreA
MTGPAAGFTPIPWLAGRTGTMEKIPFTPQGLETIKEELAHLKGHERQAVINAIAEAREHGDLSENAEYHAAREKQSFIEGRITELEESIFHIVGPYEADINRGLVSTSSPIAKGLIGKSVGDSAEVHTPGGVKSYEIISIELFDVSKV